MNATPPERTEVRGWSSHAIRRNLQFLYSVDETGLEGLQGVAVTLTVRECPPTAKDWGKARDALLEALRRSHVELVHWVTEWQRRGVPHLHLAAYWPKGHKVPSQEIRGHWLRITQAWESKSSGQHLTPIYDTLGWNQYVSKHAGRGLSHYQRNTENVPEGWQGGSTGRMWGKLGPWPLQESYKLDLEAYEYHRFRRMVRSWRKANARKPFKVIELVKPGGGSTRLEIRNGRRIRSARRMLSCPHRKLSAVRGVSEWVPEALAVRMAGAAQASDPPPRKKPRAPVA